MRSKQCFKQFRDTIKENFGLYVIASEYGNMMEYGLGTYGGDCVDTIRKGFNK